MNAVCEHHAAVVARTLEAAEVAANHVHLAELARLNRIAHPCRCGIEAQNVSDLQNAFMFVRDFRERLGFIIRQRQRLFDKHIFARFEKFFAQRKMRLRRGDDDHAVHFGNKFFIVRREPLGGKAELARGFELLVANFGDVKFNRQIVQIAKMIRAPATETEQKNFSHAIGEDYFRKLPFATSENDACSGGSFRAAKTPPAQSGRPPSPLGGEKD